MMKNSNVPKFSSKMISLQTFIDVTNFAVHFRAKNLLSSMRIIDNHLYVIHKVKRSAIRTISQNQLNNYGIDLLQIFYRVSSTTKEEIISFNLNEDANTSLFGSYFLLGP